MNWKKYDYFRPSLGHCWVIAIILMATSFLFSILLALLGLSDMLMKYTSFAYIFTMLGPLVYICLAVNKASGFGFDTPVPYNQPSFGKIKPVIFFAILLFCPILISVIIDPLSGLIPMSDTYKSLFENIFYGTPLWDTILATSIMAPLFEEFLCRGVMLRGMLSNGMKPWKAIVWSSLIFAVIHMNPWQGLSAFVLALFFGWVYYRTKCLWATIFLHFVNNFSSIMLGRIFPDMGVDESLSQMLPTMTFVIIFVCAALALAGIIYYFDKKLDKNEEKPEEEIISA